MDVQWSPLDDKVEAKMLQIFSGMFCLGMI